MLVMVMNVFAKNRGSSRVVSYCSPSICIIAKRQSYIIMTLFLDYVGLTKVRKPPYVVQIVISGLKFTRSVINETIIATYRLVYSRRYFSLFIIGMLLVIY